MLNTHFRIAFRSLWRKRSFTVLNILGLTVGMAATLLLFLVIRNEMSYDAYHSKKDRIYRVVTTHNKRSNGEVAEHSGSVPIPLAAAMRQDFPAFEKVAATWYIGSAQMYVPQKNGEEKKFKENSGIFFAEADLFNIFDYTWVEGNAAGLKEPNTAAIAKSVAEAYFGGAQQAIGQTILLWSFRIPFRVVGVFRDLPENTDIPVRIAGSYPTLLKRNMLNVNHWGATHWSQQCFVLAADRVDIRKAERQLPAFVKKYYNEQESPTYTTLHFQALRDMHLDERFHVYNSDRLSPGKLWALGLIGLFLLLVACINFINLATAQSVNRAKEIGVRKVLGSDRLQLLRQFLYETALITFLALVLACAIALMAAPYLGQLIKKPLSLDVLHYPSILLFLLATWVTVTLLAGFYPAIVISGFNPVTAIKSRISARTIGGISLRRGLVVFQFVIAQLLIIGTLVVVKQMEYFQRQPLGFEKEAVALVELPSDSVFKLKYHYLKDRLSAIPGVASASLCMDAPAGGVWEENFYFNNDAGKQAFSAQRQFADTGYFNTFRLQLAAGRLPFASDTTNELLVNETMVRRLGLKSPDDILGKTISFDGKRQHPVVGVLLDYNSQSLHTAIQPLVWSSGSNTYSFIALRFEKGRMATSLPAVEKAFTEIYPTYIYDCTFFNERIGRFYASEAMTAELFKLFAALAIFISCLGLYGLVSFMAVQKTKEVGIRKVLGASVQHIVYLFSREFTILIGIAFLIAAPLGYYGMREWLSGFYYHTSLGWGVFVLAVLASVAIAWITVGYKALKAAMANPVKSLRTE